MRNAFIVTLWLALASSAMATAGPGRFVELFNAASAAQAAENYAESERLLRQALAQRPAHPTATYRLAAALARQGKLDDAIDTLRTLARQGLSFDPEKDPAGDFAPLADKWGYGSVKREFERNRRETGRPTTLFRLTDPSFMPDGIAFDEDRRHYFVGSIRHRRIQRILVDGEETDFVRPAYGGLWAPLGMAADSARRVLWVATAAIPEMEGGDPAELGKTAIIAYDLDTNRTKARYLLEEPGEHRLNDLVVLRNGMIYATDNRAGLLYSLNTTSGKFEALTAPGQLASPQGIAVSDNRKTLYIADYTQGLFRYDIGARTLERMTVDPKVSVYGIDGLARWRDDLVAVQNGIEPQRVVRLVLGDRGRRVRAAEVLASNVREFDEPTHGVVVGEQFAFVANSQRHRFTDDHQLPPKAQLRRPVILRVPVDERDERDARDERNRFGEPRPPESPRLPLPRLAP